MIRKKGNNEKNIDNFQHPQMDDKKNGNNEKNIDNFFPFKNSFTRKKQKKIEGTFNYISWQAKQDNNILCIVLALLVLK